ncbi:ureidoglycolate lyase [Diaphorobacter caeni]|uniref:ureidoglycolate lyase n=1 Tax=Diaphorobacter caeni TaxID=2784387 RepID=UPI00188F9AF8|nr:ureidoglycolate lyase [Diaphorobacter caeni]MBF5006577.1 ureidoglycolate lyase [Diaphorobacter caeni]
MPQSSTPNAIAAQPLSEENFAPFGWTLGRDFPSTAHPSAFTNPATDFWSQHIFQTGAQDGAEVLWVNYRNMDPFVTHLEKHLLTEQAIVPLTGSIIQLMACSTDDGGVDLSTATAFIIHPGQGICMRPGAWHATRSTSPEVTCLMLTRASTTVDLVRHLTLGECARESAITEIPRLEIAEAWRSTSPPVPA